MGFGFYRKQMLLFAGIGLMFVGLGWLVSLQRSDAAGRPIALPEEGERLAINLELADHGLARVLGTTVTNTVSFERDYDEFRYLVLSDLDRPISGLSVTLSYPRPVEAAAALQNALIIYSPESQWQGMWLNQTSYQYSIHELAEGSSLTLVSRLPKGIILPSLIQRLVGRVLGWPHLVWLAISAVFPIGALLVYLIVVSRVHVVRRHPGGERTTPPDARLSPAAVAGLIDGRISVRAIAATILDLARRDYLEIGHRHESYTFTKRKKAFDAREIQGLARHEQILLDNLFPNGRAQTLASDVRIRIGEQLFSREVAEFYLVLYESLATAGFFRQSPALIQGSYRLTGLIIFFMSLFGFLVGAIFFAEALLPLLIWVGSLLVGLAIVSLAPRMSSYTSRGRRMHDQWLMFRRYLVSRRPIDWRTFNQQVYVDYLPYAMALGVEEVWAQRFLGAPFQIPDWYQTEAAWGEVDGFVLDLLPMIGFLSREFAATKDPRLS